MKQVSKDRYEQSAVSFKNGTDSYLPQKFLMPSRILPVHLGHKVEEGRSLCKFLFTGCVFGSCLCYLRIHLAVGC